MSTSSFNTKMCYKAYVGCFNTDCTYAHAEHECRKGFEFARQGVRFLYPKNDFLHRLLPSLIVRFDEEEDEEDEVDEKKEKVERAAVAAIAAPKTYISLSQIDAIIYTDEYQAYEKIWLKYNMMEAASQRLWHMIREYASLTMTFGEQDMDCSA
jgi:hypothetical protein